MTTRWARFARGWIAAAVSVFVALCSHVLAGGQPPSPVAVVLCLAFAGMTCIALTGRSLSISRLAISVVVSQLLFHGAFSLLAGTTASEAPAAAVPAMTMAPHSLSFAPVVDSGMSMPAWMWAAHAIAAVLTITALRFGERAFWHCIDLAIPFVRLLLQGVPNTVEQLAPRAVPTLIELLPKRLDAMLATVRHRGPPALAAL
jgi:hypothetical protein